jgi:hypothetical protein
MNTNTKEYLRDHPCYLIAAIVLASEGNPDILKQIYGNEKDAFGALQIAQVYAGNMRVHQPSDFPIYVSPQGDITKIPERLAGLIFSDTEFFTALVCDRSPTVIYDESWLATLPKPSRLKLKEKYKQLITCHELPDLAPPHPGHSVVTPSKLLV